MQPVLAVYAGYSLAQEHVNPGADLEPYVQDALDELEYVTGGPDTKWGAERVKDGHPAPFKLTYVEIGNEDKFDKSGSYDGRYAQFYKAIKAKYPDLQLIATMPLKNMKPDVQDDHYYVRATQNFADATHYDKVDRNGPKIFVGEWATREGAPTPNMGAALGDAAWMTGLERNSDLIVMACVCAAAGECESRRHAVGDGPDRLQRDEELRLACVLRAGDVRVVSWRSHGCVEA